jgi:phosphodiesterase/alkaline phosphatase D-like protein
MVDGLEPGTTYWYQLVALDEENHILDTREASFRTRGINKSEGLTDVQGDDVQCTKVLRDGHIYIIRGGQMYDVRGQLIIGDW